MRTREFGERGMTLIEVLVATAILAVAILIALAVYDASRGAYKKGENATEQQESVRIAYDRIVADLRMLGYNSDPDGDPARPDEKLEVGLDHAIIFRGDFDAEDALKKVDHETALAGGKFNVVTTGNDEVVGYVLSRPDGTGPDAFTFQADVDDQPRNGNVTTVTVNNVVLNPTNPPYTLYKISLNNNVGTCCAGAFIVRTPVIENVRNISFQYFDSVSAAPIAAPGTAETAAVKALRAGVAKFNVSLIGMTKDPDMNYNDTSDPASRRYRKFELRGDVIPRNMTMKGVQDLNTSTLPPGKPATPTLVAGHCGGLIVAWAPNPTSDHVTMYRINYGPAAGVIAGTRSTGASPFFLDGLTTGSTYYVSIQAQNGGGDVSVKSNEASATVANTNTPRAPLAPTGTTDQLNFVRLNWTPVVANTAGVPAADPMAPLIRDLAGYRIYRGDTSGVTATAGNLLANESVVRAPGMPPYDDTTTINCHAYYYRVTAVDTCGLESAATAVFSGQSTSSIPPNAPQNVQAFVVGSDVTVSWTAVTKDTSGANVTIKEYDVYRSRVMPRSDPLSSVTFPSTPIATVSGTSYTDTSVPGRGASETIYYMVRAKDECVNVSADSDITQATCAFSGTVVIDTPIEGSVVAGPVTTTVSVVGGTDTYTGVTITYTHASSGLTRTFTSTTTGTTWTDNMWLAMPTGPYTITATVTNSTGCSSSTSVGVNAGSSAGCCLSIYPTTTTTATCASGTLKCKEVSYRMGNDHCLTAVSLLSMTVQWTDYSNNHPRWQTAKFNGTAIAAVGSWVTTYVGLTNEVGIATKTNFTAPSPEVAYLNPMTPGNTTLVTYVFDNFTDSKVGSTRYADVFDTNSFVFTLLDSAGSPSGITTTCDLPSLTVN